MAITEHETQLRTPLCLGSRETPWGIHPWTLPCWGRHICLSRRSPAASPWMLITSPKPSFSAKAWCFHPLPNSNIRLPSKAEFLASDLWSLLHQESVHSLSPQFVRLCFSNDIYSFSLKSKGSNTKGVLPFESQCSGSAYVVPHTGLLPIFLVNL